MKCPKCGYERQSRDNAFVPPTECPACSVVYAKHGIQPAADPPPPATTPPHLKPSPVDPQSLRKARERVEQRLSRRLKEQLQDERHVRTLQLAKQLTAEQVKLRQEKWQQSRLGRSTSEHAATQSPPTESEVQAGADIPQAMTILDAPRQSADTLGSGVPSGDALDQVKGVADPMLRPSTASAAPQPAGTDPHPLPTQAVEPISPVPPPQTPSRTPGRKRPFWRPHPAEMKVRSGRRGLPRLLHLVAWLILIAGMIGAVLSWITITDVEAGVRFPIPDEVGSLPIGLLLGFAYLATGILGFAFFWVSSLISLQLKDIRQILLFSRPSTNFLQNFETVDDQNAPKSPVNPPPGSEA